MNTNEISLVGMDTSWFTCDSHTYRHCIQPFLNSAGGIVLCNVEHAATYRDSLYIPFSAVCGMVVPSSVPRRVTMRPIPRASGIDLPYVFNPGLMGVNLDGTCTSNIVHSAHSAHSFLLSVRASTYKFGKSQIFLQTVSDTAPPRREACVTPPDPWTYEDARLFLYNGELCMYATCIYDYTPGVPTRTLCGWIRMQDGTVTFPAYGHNANAGPEKNWGFFDAGEGRLYTVYSHTPWVVLDCTDAATVREVARCEWTAATPLHGGAPPLKWRGRWWSFCHAVTTFDTYVVVFEESTWQPTHWGKLFDGKDFSGVSHVFAFVAGAVAKGDEGVVLSAGINDAGMGLFEFSAADVDACLRPVPLPDI